jgi:regulator of RNase E activity RraA
MSDASLTEALALLGQASWATIQTPLFRRGLQNTFLHGVRPLNPDAARMVATALTLRYIPAREDLDVLSVFKDPAHPQRKAFESIGHGELLVVDSRGDGRAASAGHIPPGRTGGTE